MKRMSLWAAALLLCTSSATCSTPPFYYNQSVKVTNPENFYFGCVGVVKSWQSETKQVTVKDLCDDYIERDFKADELKAMPKTTR